MIPASYFAMIAIERFGGGRLWPGIRFRRTKGAVFFVMPMTINAIVPWLT